MLPKRRTITRGQLVAITSRYGLALQHEVPRPWTGATSHVYPLGDVVVKVPFDRPDAIEANLMDAAIAPFARDLGVDTPELVTLDDRRDIVPVPFAIFRRAEGAVPLDREGSLEDVRGTWHEVGRQLTRVHAVTEPSAVPVALRSFRQTPEVDPRPWIDELHESSRLSTAGTHWLRELLDHLALAALAEEPLALCHGDVNAANVLVGARIRRFRALIDWAGAGWLDPAWDFAGVPLDVVPWMLAGHRSIAPLPGDATAEARIVWCQIQTRLHAAWSAPDGTRVEIDVDQIHRFASRSGWLP